ncbi:ABC transporter ATP-binding protein [uncultured Catenibacterium sp.]|uniref:ABC transporter ATP-binding protein n=1 Tax=uncultured Catenibacterium sp. TaxID=286142 RepID=UPI0025EBA0A7|nr:ABC transporter ATP-binding protein [uncultured Catenibacterium sp.]
MIKVKDLYKVIDGEVVLDHLNMHVEEGSIYGLIGPNGAGKTTLIRHLVGVLKQDSGKIFIESQPVYENIELKRKIGYISDAMYFIETNLERNAKVYKDLYPSWNQDRFKELYKTFKLNPTKKIQTFSKGMRKQASFCLIMSTMPEYLILDEPIDGLDPVARKLVWKYIIDDVAQRNLTVLISSHNLKELEGIVDHVGILYKGKIMKEFDLEYIQTHIHKIQVSFGDEEVNLDALNIAYQEERGSVKILIIEDSLSHIRKVIGEKAPLIFDILPLSLEELFMYEVGGEDDDIQKLIF